MSLTQTRTTPGAAAPARVTAEALLQRKRSGQPITCITAYDYPTARIVDEAGIDLILVGDSLGMAVLGHRDTLSVTMDEMLHHTKAVARGTAQAFLVADMPFGSYHASPEEAIRNGTRFLKESHAQAVKIEGPRASLTARLTEAEIPVVAHLGLTPQSVHRMSGYKVQGKSPEAGEQLLADAIALESAGAIALVLEGIPRELASRITQALTIPTIGIGAGPDCDGQILVFHDLFHLTFAPAAKFTRQYADAQSVFTNALRQYRDDVISGSFPSDAESYHLPRTAELVTA
jgi:3-methyl-2-oxobutanoate hydroxymethyltransferase